MAAGDLITLAQAGNWLSLSAGQYEADPILPGLISAFSQFFLTLISRPTILSTEFTERRNGTGTNILGLINTPIISVTSVVVSNINVPASPDGVAPGYVADENTIQLIGGHWNGVYFPLSPGFASGYPAVFIKGIGNVFVTYTAGYETAPLDVQQCICEMVGWAYKYKDRIGMNSSTTPQVFVNNYSQQPLSPMAKLCVQRYKKKAIQW